MNDSTRSTIEGDGPVPPIPLSFSDADLAIVGAGIVGLATAWQLLRKHPALRVVVLEKEAGIAAHQSGHNSGVVHAGLYYRPGTLRARLCRDGGRELQAFCETEGIPIRRCGKLVVALDDREVAALATLADRARQNGVEGLREIGAAEMREIEPAVGGRRALLSPTTGVIDFREVARALARRIAEMGGAIETNHAVTGIEARRDRVELRSPAGNVSARFVISCAGLHADRVAAFTGDEGTTRIVPFRGDYYTFRPRAASLVRALIYPVPDPRYPFLGVHFTRTIHDEVHAGPNAVLAFAREGYRVTTVSLADLADMVRFRGFRRLARAHVKTGIHELWRDLSKRAFLGSLRRYIPELRGEDLVFGPSGVRAQALDEHGRLLDDFDFGGADRVLHVRNAPSPAATASLAIGRHHAAEAETRFTL